MDSNRKVAKSAPATEVDYFMFCDIFLQASVRQTFFWLPVSHSVTWAYSRPPGKLTVPEWFLPQMALLPSLVKYSLELFMGFMRRYDGFTFIFVYFPQSRFWNCLKRRLYVKSRVIQRRLHSLDGRRGPHVPLLFTSHGVRLDASSTCSYNSTYGICWHHVLV